MMRPESSSPALGAWQSQSGTEASPSAAAPPPQSAAAFGTDAPQEGRASSAAFGDGGGPAAGYSTTSAPVGLLVGSLAASALSLVLAGLFEQIVVAAVAWVLAALFGMGLATFFVVKDTQRQANPWYLYKKTPALLHRISVVAAVLAVAVAAVRIALYVGRL
ncbi:hypothetical protein [Actinomyces procaprae]|uniref:hypothetical protein n=1 Tax=Actinomyces procaprae TaxID=2560010 RepID=UPI0010A24B4B|nr:hypothetical protein [Actinomyces procaprae]